MATPRSAGSRPRRALLAAAVLSLAAPPAAATPARLLAGTALSLELEQHVTSAYTPAGSTIRFRVAADVLADGRVVIRRGTPVAGRLRQATDRAMVGTSGSMTLGVDFVAAVDGQAIRVIANETRQGRDRGNALAGWTILWGLGGLVTHGAHSWLPRGSQLPALVLFDRRIEGPERPPEVAADQQPPAGPGRVTGHRFSTTRADPIRLDLDREAKLGEVVFRFAEPPGGGAGWRAELVAVDELPLI